MIRFIKYKYLAWKYGKTREFIDILGYEKGDEIELASSTNEPIKYTIRFIYNNTLVLERKQ